MPHIVARTGIKREPGHLYFLRGNVVFKKPLRLIPGGSRTEQVCVADFIPQEGYVYHLNAACDVIAAEALCVEL